MNGGEVVICDSEDGCGKPFEVEGSEYGKSVTCPYCGEFCGPSINEQFGGDTGEVPAPATKEKYKDQAITHGNDWVFKSTPSGGYRLKVWNDDVYATIDMDRDDAAGILEELAGLRD